MPDETRPRETLMSPTPSERFSTAAAFLAAIDTLLPELRGRADEVEQRGMVPDDIIRSLTAIGVFRALQPKQWGGLELDFAPYYEGMIRLASACSSTGWVASVVGIHPWHAALFAPAAQRELWADNPDARMSTSLAPTGQVERVSGGFRLSGKWPFSSGVDHCEWAVLAGNAPGESGAVYHTFLVPRRDYTIDQESWKVNGLAGTGSKTVSVPGAFVPEHRAHSIVDNYNGTDPGLAINDRPYYWRSTTARITGCRGGWCSAIASRHRRRAPLWARSRRSSPTTAIGSRRKPRSPWRAIRRCTGRWPVHLRSSA
jgi:3-hydroxy-9,10-secoandrosta-1,3,5(10)-triene-9,17-dione monooxygenase